MKDYKAEVDRKLTELLQIGWACDVDHSSPKLKEDTNLDNVSTKTAEDQIWSKGASSEQSVAEICLQVENEINDPELKKVEEHNEQVSIEEDQAVILEEEPAVEGSPVAEEDPPIVSLEDVDCAIEEETQEVEVEEDDEDILMVNDNLQFGEKLFQQFSNFSKAIYEQGYKLSKKANGMANRLEQLNKEHKKEKLTIEENLQKKIAANKNLQAENIQANEKVKDLELQVTRLRETNLNLEDKLRQAIKQMDGLEHAFKVEQQLRKQADGRTRLAIKKAREYLAMKKAEVKKRLIAQNQAQDSVSHARNVMNYCLGDKMNKVLLTKKLDNQMQNYLQDLEFPRSSNNNLET